MNNCLSDFIVVVVSVRFLCPALTLALTFWFSLRAHTPCLLPVPIQYSIALSCADIFYSLTPPQLRTYIQTTTTTAAIYFRSIFIAFRCVPVFVCVRACVCVFASTLILNIKNYEFSFATFLRFTKTASSRHADASLACWFVAIVGSVPLAVCYRYFPTTTRLCCCCCWSGRPRRVRASSRQSVSQQGSKAAAQRVLVGFSL